MPNKLILSETEQEILANMNSRIMVTDPRYNISTILKILKLKLPWLHEQFLDERSRVNKKSMSVNKTLEFNGFSGKFAHLAAYYGCDKLLKFLLDRDTDLNALDQDKNTLLHYAAMSGSIKTLNVLLEKGVSENINTENKYGETPLDLAYASGNLATINTIIAMGGITSEEVSEEEVTSMEVGVEVEVAIEEAAAAEIMEMETEAYISIDVLRDQDGKTPLHLAVVSGNLEVVSLLLQAEADINAKDAHSKTPLHYAAANGSLTILKYLLENGADINTAERKNGRMAVHYAVANGSSEILEYLLKKGADVHIKDKNEITPLQYAVAKGNLEVVSILLENGADIKDLDQNAQSRLDALLTALLEEARTVTHLHEPEITSAATKTVHR